MKKVISIALILLLLISQLGLAIGTHYCMGLAVKSEVSLGPAHLDCGMGQMEVPCANDGKEMIAQSPCCQNVYVSAEVSDDFRTAPALDQFSPHFVAAVPSQSFFGEHLFTRTKEAPVLLYKSPPRLLDVRVAFQIFRL